jgi:hypothetical protein
VEPAGGETGEPHCLAEVHEPPNGGIDSPFGNKDELGKINAFRAPSQMTKKKNDKTTRGRLPPHLASMIISILVQALKCKPKMAIFYFFLRPFGHPGVLLNISRNRSICPTDLDN